MDFNTQKSVITFFQLFKSLIFRSQENVDIQEMVRLEKHLRLATHFLEDNKLHELKQLSLVERSYYEELVLGLISTPLIDDLFIANQTSITRALNTASDHSESTIANIEEI